MARGKQAARSATRRAEAAHEHIDRLTDQLVEAKTRARRHEAAATHLPVVEQELARLRRQVEEGTSDILEKERALHQAQTEDFADRFERLAGLLRTALDRYEEKHGEMECLLYVKELTEMDKLLGRDAAKDSRLPRYLRRQRVTMGAFNDSIRRATPQQLRERGLRRVGHLIGMTDDPHMDSITETVARETSD